MTDDTPIACSLDAGQLRQRLDAIAVVGADALVSRHVEDNRHLLWFRAEPEVRRRLEEIVVAEEECCSFLELSLDEDGDALVLAIGSPDNARQVADELAQAFARVGP